MSAARKVVEAVLNQPDVVMVYEAGTADPFTALYINGSLVVSNVRGDISAVLTALGITPREVFVAKGFDGQFPEKLKQLRFTEHH